MKIFKNGNGDNTKSPKDHTKGDNRYKSKIVISDKYIKIPDTDARLIDIMGNRAEKNYAFKGNEDGENNKFIIIPNKKYNKDLYKFVNKKYSEKYSSTVRISKDAFTKDYADSKKDSISEDPFGNASFIDVQVERYEVLKSIDHADCGLNAAIIKHYKSDGKEETILWADGSKGSNNFSDSMKEGFKNIGSVFTEIFSKAKKIMKEKNSKEVKTQTGKLKAAEDFSEDLKVKDGISNEPQGFWSTVRELLQDWVLTDGATAFGVINKQTKHLREFAMQYMYGPVEESKIKTKDKKDKYEGLDRKNSIDRAVGVSLAAIALSTLGFTKGFEDTKVAAYSGGTTEKVLEKAIKRWGDNGLQGENVENYFTSREFLSQLIKFYKANNKFYIQKESGAPDEVQHGGTSYIHNEGKDMQYNEFDYKPHAVFWPWHISTPVDTMRYKYPKLDNGIQSISNKIPKKTSKIPKSPEIPAVNMTGENGINPNILENILKETMPDIDSEPAKTSPPILSSPKDNVDLGSALADFVKTMLLEDAIPPTSGHSTLEKELNNATEVRHNDGIDKMIENLIKQKSILTNSNNTNKNMLNSIHKRSTLVLPNPPRIETANIADKSEPSLAISSSTRRIDNYGNAELKGEIEYFITSVLDDFITIRGYDRYEYN